MVCCILPFCDVNSFYHVATVIVSKMAGIGVSFRQCAVIEFFVKEEQSAPKEVMPVNYTLPVIARRGNVISSMLR